MEKAALVVEPGHSEAGWERQEWNVQGRESDTLQGTFIWNLG